MGMMMMVVRMMIMLMRMMQMLMMMMHHHVTLADVIRISPSCSPVLSCFVVLFWIFVVTSCHMSDSDVRL